VPCPHSKTITLTVVAHALPDDLVDIVHGIVPLEGGHDDGAAARLADPPKSLAPKRRHAIVPQEHGVAPFASFNVALCCLPRFGIVRLNEGRQCLADWKMLMSIMFVRACGSIASWSKRMAAVIIGNGGQCMIMMDDGVCVGRRRVGGQNH
jgi:hypothetical protein